MAHRAGVTRQTASAIEQGRSLPSLVEAFQIAQSLDVRLDVVFEYPDARREIVTKQR